uniref:Uncharacterized protein n=1 Tax=Candidatus Kentrum eta TaxID=2126337 RepID=A0A450VJZ0_9GAMM|nr:MAG: hypothetical protein BECKH772B_GA0070898_104652 [Candidatus Kentron sp. H]VFK05129.1 MAG: hypothetical protein BECKH772A_GA0070896_105062 [Candidatus Kentron sp. H]VFK07917.1 MAG: hypothetical protein BECKH772C_GA0070978_104672 [Candidatus Kentron sp. H]
MEGWQRLVASGLPAPSSNLSRPGQPFPEPAQARRRADEVFPGFGHVFPWVGPTMPDAPVSFPTLRQAAATLGEISQGFGWPFEPPRDILRDCLKSGVDYIHPYPNAIARGYRNVRTSLRELWY